MSREEFLKQLEQLLQDIPEHDRADAIAYYQDYFAEAGPEEEARVIRELGSPQKVAANIKEELKDTVEKTVENEIVPGTEKPETEQEVIDDEETKNKNHIPWALIIVLIIFASPIVIGTGGGILSGIIGLIAGIFGMVIAIIAAGVSLIISGVASFIVGIVTLAANPVEGLILMGVGCIGTAVGILLCLLFAWCVGRWIPALFRWIKKMFRKLVKKEA